jgi:hypothetical protein
VNPRKFQKSHMVRLLCFLGVFRVVVGATCGNHGRA